MNNGQYVAKLTLKEYFAALGNTSLLSLERAIGISDDAIKTAMRGQPIAYSYAQKIAQYLSQEYGRDIQVAVVCQIKK